MSRFRGVYPVAVSVVGLALGVSAIGATSAYAAQPPVGLGTAESFAVLAGSGITNTGPTTITGDVGTFPTPSETGFGSVTLNGTNHHGSAVSQGAKDDLTTAYNDAAGRKPRTNVPVELGGTTLLPGVYTSPTLGLTGTVTLNAQGNPNAQFVFQAGSTLITASNSRVSLINGARACNIVWQIGSSATFGTDTSFVGNVLAHDSITATTGATFRGRLLARGGAVTLDTNTITRSSCGVVPPPVTATPTPTPTPTPTRTHSPTPKPKPKPSATGTKPSAGGGTTTHSPAPGRSHHATTPAGQATPSSHRTHPGVAKTPDTNHSPNLPFTGLPVGDLVGTALALLAIGGFFIAITRRGHRGHRGQHS